MNTHSIQLSYENGTEDFTGGPVVKNPPSNAGDLGSIPGQETKIPHATGQLEKPAHCTKRSQVWQLRPKTVK